ncbi:hypothetical protein OTK49_21220 [Vibrio coralliirubri]|uniref:hypothetical protein n=1 Tax=Vibrio coralliirubri TaxID=1516159 RepID=UPI002284F76E|nr:hypothetical protein [Vibrio coralliirubri]MCY9865042.1 hypothetical protein [Vibrio coralliirubri]
MTFWNVELKQATFSDTLFITVFVAVYLVLVPDIELSTLFAAIGGCSVTIFGFSIIKNPVKTIIVSTLIAPIMGALGLAAQSLL